MPSSIFGHDLKDVSAKELKHPLSSLEPWLCLTGCQVARGVEAAGDLPGEPVHANLVHVVGEALELDCAEHVVGEEGGGQAEAREQLQ